MEDIIDTHLHFFRLGAECGTEKTDFLAPRFANATVKTLLGEHPEYETPEFREIIRAMLSAGLPVLPHWVEAIYCAQTAIGDEEVNRFAALALDGGAGASNETIRRLAGLFPNRIIGTVSVNPKKDGAVKELEKELGELAKSSGEFRPIVKLHPLVQGFYPVHVADDFYRVMADFGAVLDIHTGPFQSGPLTDENGNASQFDICASDPAQLRCAMERFPQINFILVHMGTPDYAVNAYWMEKGIRVEHFEHAVELMRQYPHVYGDIAGLNWTGRPGTNAYDGIEMRGYDFGRRSEWAFALLRGYVMDSDMRTKYDNAVGLRDKIVFGTDYPITDHPNRELARQKRILGFNPALHSKRVLLR